MRTRSFRRLSAGTFLVVAVLAPLAAPALLPQLAPPAGAQAAGSSAKTVTKNTVDGGPQGKGNGTGVSRAISLTMDKTTELQGRERVGVSWTGAQPTPNPFAAGGEVAREFPMVLMQCRGVDSPTTQIDRRTCFVDNSQRNNSNGYLQADALVPEAGDPAAADVPFSTPFPPPVCKFIGEGNVPGTSPADGLPYVGVDGSVYYFCVDPELNPKSYPPDLPQVEAALRTQSYAAATLPDGTGSYQFEVRTREQHGTLGCSADVACSLVAVPVMQPNCLPGAASAGLCALGSQSVGSAEDPGRYTNPFLKKDTWWFESNWRNRLSIPLEFLPTAGQCSLADSRPALNLDGSELMAGAMRQWLPRFCLDGTSPFRLSYAPTGEALARANLSGGRLDAALTTRPAETTDPPVVNAPIAVTGFAVSFTVESREFFVDPRTIPVREINLTPRLLAKLLTESYPSSVGSYMGPTSPSHPTIGKNPKALNLDPDFLAANPAYAATPGDKTEFPYISLVSVDSDVIYELTRYVVADPAARAWLAGAPDEYGMVINPEFTDVAWPSGQVELRDTTPELKELVEGVLFHGCAQDGVPQLNRLVNPVQSLLETGQSVLDSKPLAVVRCKEVSKVVDDKTVLTWDIDKRQFQAEGNRATLAISSVADAAQYNVDVAGLQVGTDEEDKPVFVKPTEKSMRTALGAMEVDPTTKTLRLDHSKLSAFAYPGTMVVNAAVPTTGLEPTLAGNYASFLEQAAGPLQTPGTAVGQLPAGYVPLPEELAAVTRAAAGLVRAQQGNTVPETSPPDVPTDQVPAAVGRTDPAGPFTPGGGLGAPITGRPAAGPGATGTTGGGSAVTGTTTGGGAAGSPTVPTVAPVGDPAAPVQPAGVLPETTPGEPPLAAPTANTRADQSAAGRWALPTLLGAGLLAGVLGPLAFLALQPGNPGRAAGAWLLSRVRGT